MTQLTGGFVSTLLLFVLLLSVTAGEAAAQNPSGPSWRFGIGGGAVLALPSSSFDELPGIPQPAGASVFQPAGTGARFAPHLFVETPSLLAGTSFGLQLDYQSLPALLQATEQFDIRGGDSQIITVTNSHEISASLRTVGGELFAHVPLVAALGVRIGIRGDIPVSDAFAQSQEITDPPELEFVGYEGRVVTASGSLPGRAALLTSLSFGVTYTINRESPWPLQVGGVYRLGLTDVVSPVDWRMSAGALTLSLLYAPAAQRPVLVDTVFRRDTTVRLVAGLPQEKITLLSSESSQTRQELPEATVVTVQTTEQYAREVPRPGALLTAGLAIRFLLDGGREVEQVSTDVRITEITRQVFCSGTMLYNEQQEDNPFYGMFSRDFSEEQERELGFNAYDMQRRLLQHIKTVWDSSGVEGKIVVSYMGTHLREANDAAAMLRQICAEAWGIKPEAVPVEVELSRPRGHGSLPIAEMENLVSIAFLPQVTRPLVIRDTVAQSPVRQVLFRPSVVSEAGVHRWELRLMLDTMLLYVQSGKGNMPDELVWKPDADVVTGRFAGRTIRCLLTVEDREGQQTVANGEVVFRNSGRNGQIDKKSLRFIVEGLGLASVAGYIREQAQRSSLVPVQVHYWYAGDVQFSPVQSVGSIAHSLNVPEKRILTHPNPQPFRWTIEGAYIDVLEIFVGVPPPER